MQSTAVNAAPSQPSAAAIGTATLTSLQLLQTFATLGAQDLSSHVIQVFLFTSVALPFTNERRSGCSKIFFPALSLFVVRLTRLPPYPYPVFTSAC